MLAVQGPKARAIVGSMAQGELPARHRVADMNLGTGDALVCGTGYTGEDGVEILVQPDEASALWEELAGGPVLRIWCDGTLGPYLWQTLLGIAREEGGAAVGLRKLFPEAG